jgi:hypothetical protein
VDLLMKRLGARRALARRGMFALALVLLFPVSRAEAQLLSPGKLIKDHTDLEGLRRCTKCHQLGERGVSNEKCLDCHRELADRITRKTGFHATIGAKSCGECHKDHFGPDFDALHFDTTAFDHAEAGYDLAGKHADVACRECHRPEFITDAAVRKTAGEHGRLATTFLGLGTTCLTCHRKDDPHNGQFGTRGCEECHSEGDWKKPDRFDHAKTRYPLRGRHRDIQCRECHTPIPGKQGALQLTGLEFATCSACHQKDDPHAGQFKNRRCEECHSELDWKKPDKFDHASTRYPLTGRHRDVACEKCHTPMPGRAHALRLTGLEFGTCADCHTKDDPHKGRLGTKCTDCHTTDGWKGRGGAAFESAFDHAKTRFALKGKHATVKCAACHSPANARAEGIALSFIAETRDRTYPVPVSANCTSCHVDYHRGAFAESPGGQECASCHGEDGWTPTTYDIARHNRDAKYKLTGAHLATPCVACHKNPDLGQQTLQFKIARQECVACHQAKDPHGDQFVGRACDDCHETRAFKIAAFDHSRTRYPLDGAHRNVPCASCHPSVTGADGRPTRVYRPLHTACRDCHEGGSR